MVYHQDPRRRDPRRQNPQSHQDLRYPSKKARRGSMDHRSPYGESYGSDPDSRRTQDDDRTEDLRSSGPQGSGQIFQEEWDDYELDYGMDSEDIGRHEGSMSRYRDESRGSPGPEYGRSERRGVESWQASDVGIDRSGRVGGPGRFRRDFRGRGPKGYSRSDERIREDVCDRLADDRDIDASEIEVQVSKGEVTLSGMVDERRTKHLAEDLADRISGVREINNQIRVQRRNQESDHESDRGDGSNTKSRSRQPNVKH